MRKARPVGNRGRFRFSIGGGAFPASHKQGVDVKSRAIKSSLDSLQEVLGGRSRSRRREPTSVSGPAAHHYQAREIASAHRETDLGLAMTALAAR